MYFEYEINLHYYKKLLFKFVFHCSLHLGPVYQSLRSELVNLNFQSLEIVSRYRDPQLQVTENTVQALKYPSADAVTLYMPGFKAIN